MTPSPPPAPETATGGEQRPSRRGRKAKAEEVPAPAEDPAPETPVTDTQTPPWEGDEEPENQSVPAPLPKCPDGDRIFAQHRDNPEIPLCPNIDAAHCCHKEGGPDVCPLWDRPKAPEAAPKMDVNPPRRSRKKREEA